MEATAKLQSLQIKLNEPLITYDSRYESIHHLLRKITKKDSYIKTLDDASKQAREIDKESSFEDAASGRYSEQTATKIETHINELDDSFQDCNINAVSTRLTNILSDGSFNGSFDQI